MRTAHRNAAHAKRAQPSKFWQPAITAAQVSTCKLAHWDAFDRLTRPHATQNDLMDWVEAGLTYTELMRLIEADGTEFTPEAKDVMAENNDAERLGYFKLALAQFVLSATTPAPAGQIDYEPLFYFAEKNKLSYNELCAAVRQSIRAPRGDEVNQK